MQVLKNMKMPEKNAGYILIKIQGKRLTFEKHTLTVTNPLPIAGEDKGHNIYIDPNYSELLGVITLPAPPDVVVELSGRLGDIFKGLDVQVIDTKPTICGVKEFERV